MNSNQNISKKPKVISIEEMKRQLDEINLQFDDVQAKKLKKKVEIKSEKVTISIQNTKDKKNETRMQNALDCR